MQSSLVGVGEGMKGLMADVGEVEAMQMGGLATIWAKPIISVKWSRAVGAGFHRGLRGGVRGGKYFPK